MKSENGAGEWEKSHHAYGPRRDRQKCIAKPQFTTLVFRIYERWNRVNAEMKMMAD